jgi:hypothetical protein
MKMEQTERSETLAFTLQTPVNNPEESVRHSEQCESLKSRTTLVIFCKKDMTLFSNEQAIMDTLGNFI